MAPYTLLQIHNSMIKMVNMADMVFSYSIMKPTYLALFCAYLVQTALVLATAEESFLFDFSIIAISAFALGPIIQ